MDRTVPRGIKIFGALLMTDAVIQLIAKAEFSTYYPSYSSIFEPLPSREIFFRYILSIIFRILEFGAGLGLVLRIDILRKFTILMSWVTIGIVYWKHPYGAFFKYTRDSLPELFEKFGFRHETIAPFLKYIEIVALFLVYAIDVGFAAGMIYYFTRPSVKKHFSNNTLVELFKK